jgi:hypothetical protein
MFLTSPYIDQALSQLCAFCSPDRRKESANLCYGDLSTETRSEIVSAAAGEPAPPSEVSLGCCACRFLPPTQREVLSTKSLLLRRLHRLLVGSYL